MRVLKLSGLQPCGVGSVNFRFWCRKTTLNRPAASAMIFSCQKWNRVCIVIFRVYIVKINVSRLFVMSMSRLWVHLLVCNLDMHQTHASKYKSLMPLSHFCENYGSPMFKCISSYLLRDKYHIDYISEIPSLLRDLCSYILHTSKVTNYVGWWSDKHTHSKF